MSPQISVRIPMTLSIIRILASASLAIEKAIMNLAF
ncbi:hypothetical protein Avbf_13955 [Armadillidium vulgare]|nr:hypothetical protein Avbf_13955 [Armadillidium vulgare]